MFVITIFLILIAGFFQFIFVEEHQLKPGSKFNFTATVVTSILGAILGLISLNIYKNVEYQYVVGDVDPIVLLLFVLVLLFVLFYTRKLVVPLYARLVTIAAAVFMVVSSVIALSFTFTHDVTYVKEHPHPDYPKESIVDNLVLSPETSLGTSNYTYQIDEWGTNDFYSFKYENEIYFVKDYSEVAMNVDEESFVLELSCVDLTNGVNTSECYIPIARVVHQIPINKLEQE